MRQVELWSPELGWSPRVRVHGHWGRPVMAFPTSQGSAQDWERHAMVDAVRPLLDAGRLKLFLLDSFDDGSWYRRDLPLEQRARLWETYERWVVHGALPWVRQDCGGREDVLLTGASLGAYHAVALALRRADLFGQVLAMSGVYDLSKLGWGERGEAFHLATPLALLGAAGGEHLQWLRRQLHLVLVCGRGQWEDTTGAHDSTVALGRLAQDRGLRVELDVWGHDTPHDWPSWRAQLAAHLPRLV